MTKHDFLTILEIIIIFIIINIFMVAHIFKWNKMSIHYYYLKRNELYSPAI